MIWMATCGVVSFYWYFRGLREENDVIELLRKLCREGWFIGY